MANAEQFVATSITASVEVVEPLGSELHLYVSTSKNQLIARVPPRKESQVGDSVYLKVDVSKLHVFDQETEASIVQAATVG